MPTVQIYKLENNGNQTIIATCHLDNDEVVCTGDLVFIENLTRDGIRDYNSSPRQKLYPKDGKKFLENLKFAFRSGYLAATDIQP